MKRGGLWLAMAAVAAFSLAPGLSHAQGKAAPEEMQGTVKVGDKAPDFTLTAHDGETYTLSEVASKGTVAVMFFRSANW